MNNTNHSLITKYWQEGYAKQSEVSNKTLDVAWQRLLLLGLKICIANLEMFLENDILHYYSNNIAP